jgi:hypothetical protein
VILAIKFAENKHEIAGISLYSPLINEMSLLPFIPKKTGFDNYYLQSAQSWGQCWTRRMWVHFRNWYDSCPQPLLPSYELPSRVYRWPESSWKKYFNAYLVKNEKTFLFSYDSFSTNCQDVGTHNKEISSHYQVPLTSGKTKFNFGLKSQCPSYDAFFERKGMKFNGESVCFDLYGTKCKSDSRYFFSTKKISVPHLRSFGLAYRPQEDNFINRTPGNDAYLYDLSVKPDIEFKENYINYKLANYHTNITWRHSLVYTMVIITSKIFKKLRT